MQKNKSTYWTGIVPFIVKQIVDRRIKFKQLMKELPVNSLEANICAQRADTMKKLLVSLYGTTGSYWNKYGNVTAFEAINKKSRQILIRTKDIVQEQSFDLLYADVDACFIHKKGATRID